MVDINRDAQIVGSDSLTKIKRFSHGEQTRPVTPEHRVKRFECEVHIHRRSKCRQFRHALRKDFPAIRCNCIAPGTVDSPSLHQRLRDTGDYDAAMKAFVARQPMGRIGEAQEIADLALYLASDESRYMTGQCVSIDGGMTI